MNFTRKSDLVIEGRASHADNKTFLLLSDVHFDHPYCDRKLFFKLMDEAQDRNAKVLLNGDFFCMMQGKFDRRGSKGKVRPEHYGPNYFNLVVDEAAEQLAPYADNILLLADGNHETAILKHQEVNPLDMLHRSLTANTSRQMFRAGYHGFVRFTFRKKNGAGVTKLLYHHHGKYGGTVTMGVLGAKRHAAIIPQADIIWTGHTHDLWHLAHPVLTVTKGGRTETVLQHHIKTGTFKDEFNRPGGFGVERLNKPAAIGGYWMQFKIVRESDQNGAYRLKAQFTQAR